MNAFRTIGALLFAVGLTTTARAATLKLNFDALPVGPEGYYNGDDEEGGFTSHGVHFNNLYTEFGNGCCWNGWAYSNNTDTTTPGPNNEYSAYAGSGAGGSAQYGVAFSGLDAGGGIIPVVTLPTGAQPMSVKVTNTTYAALSMKNGDGFAKKFGGVSGNDPDWFLLRVEGRNNANTLLGQVQFYLADYRPAGTANDYIHNTWQTVSLAPLAGLGVTKLHFRLSSTDNGIFGMNTPAYVAIDDLAFQVTSTPGDFDLDGDVDGIDLATWNTNYGVTENGGLTTGDADDDGDVDGADFLLWQRNHTPSLPLAGDVPEPAAFVLATCCLIICLLKSRTRT